jgi:hypothetical protein
MDVAGKTVESAPELVEGAQRDGDDVGWNPHVDGDLLCTHGIKDRVWSVVGEDDHEVVVAVFCGATLRSTPEEIDSNRALSVDDCIEEARQALVSQKVGGVWKHRASVAALRPSRGALGQPRRRFHRRSLM